MKEKFYISLIVLFLMLPSVSFAVAVSYNAKCYASELDAFNAFRDTFPRIEFGEKNFMIVLLPTSSLTGQTITADLQSRAMLGAAAQAVVDMSFTIPLPACAVVTNNNILTQDIFVYLASAMSLFFGFSLGLRITKK